MPVPIRFPINNISVEKRLSELLVNYLVIVVYLLLLLRANLAISFFILDEIGAYTELQAQLIATLTSVSQSSGYFPTSIIKRIYWIEGSWIESDFYKRKIQRQFTKKCKKILPWQLGHVGVIHGLYSEFDITAIIITNAGSLLGLVLLLMGYSEKISGI